MMSKYFIRIIVGKEKIGVGGGEERPGENVAPVVNRKKLVLRRPLRKGDRPVKH